MNSLGIRLVKTRLGNFNYNCIPIKIKIASMQTPTVVPMTVPYKAVQEGETKHLRYSTSWNWKDFFLLKTHFIPHSYFHHQPKYLSCNHVWLLCQYSRNNLTWRNPHTSAYAEHIFLDLLYGMYHIVPNWHVFFFFFTTDYDETPSILKALSFTKLPARNCVLKLTIFCYMASIGELLNDAIQC